MNEFCHLFNTLCSYVVVDSDIYMFTLNVGIDFCILESADLC